MKIAVAIGEKDRSVTTNAIALLVGIGLMIAAISQIGCSKPEPQSSSQSSPAPANQASPTTSSNESTGAPLGSPTTGASSDQAGQGPGVPPGQAPGASGGGSGSAESGSTGGGASASGGGSGASGGAAGSGGAASGRAGGTASVTETLPPRTYTLTAGRNLSVFTTSTLSTKNNRSGDAFTATLARPIVDGDWVIANKGAAVEGVVTNSDPGGRVSGVASIAVKLTRLTLADGRKVELATSSVSRQAKTTRTKDATKIGIGAGIGAAIGAIAGRGKGAAIGAAVGGGAGTAAVLATRGDPAVIAGESALTFRLNAPIRVTKR
ncbi:MAG: hypothetical protein DMF61_14095 [Blastocatellia bacterium AA13]|nr:MAG: hypothetical protein DMF61_14095 [Blastocatellia bacterium AA13]